MSTKREIVFSKNLGENFKKIIESTGATNNKQIIAAALSALNWVITEQQDGKKVYSVKKGKDGSQKISELVLPFYVHKKDP